MTTAGSVFEAKKKEHGGVRAFSKLGLLEKENKTKGRRYKGSESFTESHSLRWTALVRLRYISLCVQCILDACDRRLGTELGVQNILVILCWIFCSLVDPIIFWSISKCVYVHMCLISRSPGQVAGERR